MTTHTAQATSIPTGKVSPIVNPMSLEGRTVIVTGAGQGIGRAIAELVVQLGGNAVCVDMNEEAVTELRATLGEDRTGVCIGNVTDDGFATAVVAQAVERFGGVHGLVNNAGISQPAMADRMTTQQWRQVLDVHLTGSFLFMQAVGRQVIAAVKANEEMTCSMVNISSDAGVQGTVGQINYSAAKSGILGVTMSGAREWARYGIRVNTAAFGVVETPMTEVVRGEKFRDTYLARIPLGRWGRADEAAKLVCFLLSDASSYITGQHISSNGGSQMSA
jgi:3-oxoacyl-[acyl-carrier protein] reductase